MPKYRIGDREFRSKGDAEQEVRDLLARYPFGAVVDHEEDDQLLRDLLDKHPKAEEKVGPGVSSFRVVRTPLGNHKGPQVVRLDDSLIDFSYKECFKAPTHRQRVVAAMRVEVQPEVNAYFESRSGAGTLVSDESGTALARDNVNVAYFQGPRFIDLASSFAETAGGWEAFELTATTEPGLARLANRDLAEKWCAYHMERAVLGLLSKAENRRRPSF